MSLEPDPSDGEHLKRDVRLDIDRREIVAFGLVARFGACKDGNAYYMSRGELVIPRRTCRVSKEERDWLTYRSNWLHTVIELACSRNVSGVF